MNAWKADYHLCRNKYQSWLFVDKTKRTLYAEHGFCQILFENSVDKVWKYLATEIQSGIGMSHIYRKNVSQKEVTGCELRVAKYEILFSAYELYCI